MVPTLQHKVVSFTNRVLPSNHCLENETSQEYISRPSSLAYSLCPIRINHTVFSGSDLCVSVHRDATLEKNYHHKDGEKLICRAIRALGLLTV